MFLVFNNILYYSTLFWYHSVLCPMVLRKRDMVQAEKGGDDPLAARDRGFITEDKTLVKRSGQKAKWGKMTNYKEWLGNKIQK